jgi:hypothetical protein
MVACFIGKNGSNSMYALAGIFSDEGFTNTAMAASRSVN